jgi:hypothetical protein
MADQAFRQRRYILRVEVQAAMAALVAVNQQQAGAGQAGIPLPQGPSLHPPLPRGTPPAAAGPLQAAAALLAAGPPQAVGPPPPPPQPIVPGVGVQPQMVGGVGMLRQQRPLVHRAAAPAAAAAAVGNQIPLVADPASAAAARTQNAGTSSSGPGSIRTDPEPVPVHCPALDGTGSTAAAAAATVAAAAAATTAAATAATAAVYPAADVWTSGRQRGISSDGSFQFSPNGPGVGRISQRRPRTMGSAAGGHQAADEVPGGAIAKPADRLRARHVFFA